MKNRKKYHIIALIVLLFGLFFAPKEVSSQVIEVGATGGLSYYMGDINPKMPFKQSKIGFGMVVRYYDNVRWAFRFTYTYQPIQGSDEVVGYRPERGLSFTNVINDFSVIAEFNFMNYFTGSKRSKMSPYIFGGLSLLTHNPKAADGTELRDILTDVDYDGSVPDNGTSKYGSLTMALPFGLGVKYSAGKRIGLAVEWRMNLAFTDWLDDCHAYYPKYSSTDEAYVQYADPTGFTNNSGHNDKEYIQRGNMVDNDWYGYLNFSLVYKFVIPKKHDCNAGANKNSFVTN